MSGFDRVKAWASAGRDVFALFFTPVLSVILVWLICILAYGAWEANTQAQRINFLGALSICLAVLIGLGGQWFQRNRLAGLKANGPGGISGEINLSDDDDPPTVKVETVTTTKVSEEPKP